MTVSALPNLLLPSMEIGVVTVCPGQGDYALIVFKWLILETLASPGWTPNSSKHCFLAPFFESHTERLQHVLCGSVRNLHKKMCSPGNSDPVYTKSVAGPGGPTRILDM